MSNFTIIIDFDGYVWVRTDSELAGPYADEAEARADFSDDESATL